MTATLFSYGIGITCGVIPQFTPRWDLHFWLSSLYSLAQPIFGVNKSGGFVVWRQAKYTLLGLNIVGFAGGVGVNCRVANADIVAKSTGINTGTHGIGGRGLKCFKF